jgi:hypothetical protein
MYFSFLSCGQPIDDHVWSKHAAVLRNKYGVVFLLDLFCTSDYLGTYRGWIFLKKDVRLLDHIEDNTWNTLTKTEQYIIWVLYKLGLRIYNQFKSLCISDSCYSDDRQFAVHRKPSSLFNKRASISFSTKLRVTEFDDYLNQALVPTGVHSTTGRRKGFTSEKVT